MKFAKKLIEKGFSTSQIDEVVCKLESAGLVEDEKYAQMWVENRNSLHPRSQRMMRLDITS